MNKLIAFTGKKGSGKNTLANFLIGLQLKSNTIVEDFGLDENGRLFLKQGDENFLLDTNRNDLEYASSASHSIWPFAKNYAYATPLKELIISLFNVDRECLYGTDEQKNKKLDHIRWENMPGVTTVKTPQEPVDAKGAEELCNYYKEVLSGVIYHEPGPMSAREFMQYFGTEVMRKMYSDIWSKALTSEVKAEKSALSIITDLRFDNEALDLQDLKSDGFDVKIVNLTRVKDHNDKHISESGINKAYTDFNLDNANMNLLETCQSLTQEMEKWGWLEKNA